MTAMIAKEMETRERSSRGLEKRISFSFFFFSLKVSNVYLLFKIKDSFEFGKRSVWLHSFYSKSC